MSTEPTSSLTYGDLLLETALKMGVAYYGADGTEEPQVPVDVHDLATVKRHATNALRMFLNDAPPTGWRWAAPVATFTLWASIAEDATRTVSGGAFTGGLTTLTANTSVFVETMEDAEIVINGVGTFRIVSYISGTSVTVDGDASTASNDLYSITATGDYALPQGFGGVHSGGITFARDTNQTTHIRWADESQIREARTLNSETLGFPLFAAVKRADTVYAPARRRYTLMAYPTPYANFDVQFKYRVTFDEITDVDAYPPSPLVHDETLRSACRAVIERDVDRMTDGPDWQYYRGICLPQSHQHDGRSGPRRLGYVGNPGNRTRGFRPEDFRRPNVDFNAS